MIPASGAIASAAIAARPGYQYVADTGVTEKILLESALGLRFNASSALVRRVELESAINLEPLQ